MQAILRRDSGACRGRAARYHAAGARSVHFRMGMGGLHLSHVKLAEHKTLLFAFLSCCFLFLLGKGEIFSVKKMTTGEYFGDIEITLSNGKIQKMDGWVLKEDLSLMEMNNIYIGENKK